MRRKDQKDFSRRTFLKGLQWSPLLFLPAPLHGLNEQAISKRGGGFPFPDFRYTPHYPGKSPLDDVLSRVGVGKDEFTSEKYAYEIQLLLNDWSRALEEAPLAQAALTRFLDDSIEGTSLVPDTEKAVRSGSGVEVWRRFFSAGAPAGRERFLVGIKNYLSTFSHLETAEFEIVAIEEMPASPGKFQVDVRFAFVGTRQDAAREQRIGLWRMHWKRNAANEWRALRWEATEETLSRATHPVFVDFTSLALGHTDSYRNQLAHGVDYWRTVLDGACGIDIYGNNGLAAGDFDGDGHDDLYICQPAGLPNRLYRNRGDGTFEDVTEESGVGVLDSTACAVFADFDNKGVQDLLVVCGSGPLLFLNQGNGKFSMNHDAFQFAQPPQGRFTHAAVADYDRDGRLDIYLCLYTYYLGLDQYHYPAPYFDARNGPPNFLLHNDGHATFVDRTEAAGLNVDNDRFSFACAWGDYNSDGLSDLYVANDFGRNNLYRNNGDGTFACVSAEAGVEDVGAGMSASWFDFDNDGKPDVYSAAMWSAAGIRVSQHARFHEGEPEKIRALYRQHARGNSLYRNLGNGKFQNVSASAGVDMGRWAWCSDAWDFDHDGYSDLYIANGYISAPSALPRDPADLSSFFWRQLVAKSSQNQAPSPKYEQGWNAINELIRSDRSWSGHERNVFYANNRDGTFSDVSGVVGLDFLEDARSFALADLDGDGHVEVILKNRNAPQLRVLRNVMNGIGNSISFRLRGQESNRDAIGAAVTVEAEGHRQTKYLQAGSGFLSQHTKELFFGVGKFSGTIRASIHWPNGSTQVFEHLPINHRLEFQEGSADFLAKPFAASAAYPRTMNAFRQEQLPLAIETWLIQPLSAPEFSLPDLRANVIELRSFRGTTVLLQFWSTASSASTEQLRLLHEHHRALAAAGLQVLSINLDEPADIDDVRAFAARQPLNFATLLATPEVAGIYNILYRYLFDRRRDLPVPSSFLLDKEGLIVKVYQGSLDPQALAQDLRQLSQSERTRRALPFPGTLYQSVFQRNDFTYGVALFQHGYLDQAAASFQKVIAAKPQDPEAYYNLGTLYLGKGSPEEARQYLQQAIKLRPSYPEAWNNLGMLAAEQGQTEDAIRNFKESLRLRPSYTIALVNLGNLFRRQGSFDEAERLLRRALEITPDDPEVNYSLGMLFARQEKLDQAEQFLQTALSMRPDYPDALNNLGVLYVRERRNADAEEEFQSCIRIAPDFDQPYLNLASLYALELEKQKAREILLDLLKRQPQHRVALQELEMLK